MCQGFVFAMLPDNRGRDGRGSVGGRQEEEVKKTEGRMNQRSLSPSPLWTDDPEHSTDPLLTGLFACVNLYASVCVSCRT